MIIFIIQHNNVDVSTNYHVKNTDFNPNYRHVVGGLLGNDPLCSFLKHDIFSVILLLSK